jgi:hypothetical protein
MVYGEIAPPQCALPSMASSRPPPQSTPLPPRSPSPTALTFHRWERAGFCHILFSSIPPTTLTLNPHLSDPAPRSPPNQVLSLCRPNRAEVEASASTHLALATTSLLVVPREDTEVQCQCFYSSAPRIIEPAARLGQFGIHRLHQRYVISRASLPLLMCWYLGIAASVPGVCLLFCDARAIEFLPGPATDKPTKPKKVAVLQCGLHQAEY